MPAYDLPLAPPRTGRRGADLGSARSPEARRLLLFLAALGFVRGFLPMVPHDRRVRLPAGPLPVWYYALVPLSLVAGFAVIRLARTRPLLVLGIGVLGQGAGRALQTVAATHEGYLAAGIAETTAYALFAVASYTLLAERLPRERLLLGPLTFAGASAVGNWLILLAATRTGGLGTGDGRSLLGALLIASLALAVVLLREERSTVPGDPPESATWWTAFAPITTPVEAESSPAPSLRTPSLRREIVVSPLSPPLATRLVLLVASLSVGVEFLRLPMGSNVLPTAEGWLAWHSTRVVIIQALPLALLVGLVAFGSGLGRAVRVYGFVLVAVIAVGWLAAPLRGLVAASGNGLVAVAIELVTLRLILSAAARRRMTTAYTVHAVVIVAYTGLWWILTRVIPSAGYRTAFPIGLTVALGALLVGALTILLFSPAPTTNPGAGTDGPESPVPPAT